MESFIHKSVRLVFQLSLPLPTLPKSQAKLDGVVQSIQNSCRNGLRIINKEEE